MSFSILVASNQTSFSELLRLALEDPQKAIHVRVADPASTPITEAAEDLLFDLVVLDGDLGKNDLLPLSHQLVRRNPEIRIIYLPGAEEDSNLWDFAAPVTRFNKPIYLPDLITVVQNVIQAKQGMPSSLPQEEMAAGHLAPEQLEERMFTEAARLAGCRSALLIHKGQILAHSGGLSENETVELLRRIHPSGQGPSKNPQLFFTRLGATEVLLYLQSLTEGPLLATIFDSTFTLSKIREQWSRLALSLYQPVPQPPGDPLSAPSAEPAETVAEPERKPKRKSSQKAARKTSRTSSPKDKEAQKNASPDQPKSAPKEEQKTIPQALPVATKKPAPALPAVESSVSVEASVSGETSASNEEEFDNPIAAILSIDLQKLLGDIPDPDPDEGAIFPPLATSAEEWAADSIEAENTQEEQKPDSSPIGSEN